MHRDIKQQNIIIDKTTKRLKIIDWGLAEFFLPETQYNVKVASRYYKAPELLLDYKYYDYSIDIWSLGCIMAGIIFKQEPFFLGKDNFDQLLKIVKILGTDDMFEYIKKYNIVLNSHAQEQLGRYFCI